VSFSRLCAILGVFLCIVCHAVQGQTVLNWSGIVDGTTWGDAAWYGTNWGGLFTYDVPDATTEIANFGSGISGTLNINVTGGFSAPPYSINGITINTGNNATINFNNAGRINLGGTLPVITLGGTTNASFAGELGVDTTATFTKSSSGNLNFNGLVDFNANATVNHNGANALNFNGPVTLATGPTPGLTLDTYGSRTTQFTGLVTIDGASTTTKNGNGTVTFTNGGVLDVNNTTTIAHNAGNLNMNREVDLGAVLTVTPAAGRTTSFTGTLHADSAGAGFTHNGAGNITSSGTLDIDVATNINHTGNGNLTFSGPTSLDNSLNVFHSGSGATNFSGANSTTGGGTVQLS